MTDQLSDDRMNEIANGDEVTEDELASMVTEVIERRRQSGYTRQQRLDFMLRIIKDSFPEIARDLREIYREQENVIYYARREAEHWKCEFEKEARRVDRRERERRDRPSSASLEGND